jgi:hypothetical protein
MSLCNAKGNMLSQYHKSISTTREVKTLMRSLLGDQRREANSRSLFSLFDHQIRYDDDFTVQGLTLSDGELIHMTNLSVTCTMAY